VKPQRAYEGPTKQLCMHTPVIVIGQRLAIHGLLCKLGLGAEPVHDKHDALAPEDVYSLQIAPFCAPRPHSHQYQYQTIPCLGVPAQPCDTYRQSIGGR
jgi:hypothetical protein